MPRVVVGSVLHDGQSEWYAIQRAFLRVTTQDFHYVISSSARPACLQEDTCWIPRQGRRHADGIEALASAFAESDAEYCLLLDSDAFPVKRKWSRILADCLQKHQKQFAAPIRTENLDRFPHVSFLFFPQPLAARIMGLAMRKHSVTESFLGQPVRDLGSALPSGDVFPLLRSNVFSPNPLRHSVYYDLAYHQSTGSRWSGMRGDGYWGVIARPRRTASKRDAARMKTTMLHSDPAGFINRLVGCDRFRNDELRPLIDSVRLG
jgi:hypothetical protein